MAAKAIVDSRISGVLEPPPWSAAIQTLLFDHCTISMHAMSTAVAKALLLGLQQCSLLAVAHCITYIHFISC